MQSPVAVRIVGSSSSQDLELEIERQAEELERFYGRITSCRVTITTPHRRRRRGRVHHVRIDLAVPGEAIVVGREPEEDRGHEDIRVAVRDAFRAARRRLQDHVQRARGFVKRHEERLPASELVPDATAAPIASSGRREVALDAGGVRLSGILTVPRDATALVLFAHGGSGHASPQDAYVADVLHSAHLATLLVDPRDEDEADEQRRTFDVGLLSQRLLGVARWVRGESQLRGLRLGLHGAGTGASAALVAAAEEPAFGAIVSRGGRPDLAGPALPFVAAPTLLVVGEDDIQGLFHNRIAMRALRCLHELSIVPAAGHLFDQPDALHEAARRARDWLVRHLAPPEA